MRARGYQTQLGMRPGARSDTRATPLKSRNHRGFEAGTTVRGAAARPRCDGRRFLGTGIGFAHHPNLSAAYLAARRERVVSVGVPLADPAVLVLDLVLGLALA